MRVDMDSADGALRLYCGAAVAGKLQLDQAAFAIMAIGEIASHELRQILGNIRPETDRAHVSSAIMSRYIGVEDPALILFGIAAPLSATTNETAEALSENRTSTFGPP